MDAMYKNTQAWLKLFGYVMRLLNLMFLASLVLMLCLFKYNYTSHYYYAMELKGN